MATALDELDPWRLVVAAHELGHYLVWKRAGLPVGAPRVRGTGSGVEGYVPISTSHTFTGMRQHRLYAAGLLAGGEAGKRWSAAYSRLGARQRTGNCSGDARTLRLHIRDNKNTEFGAISTSSHAAQARSLVSSYWSDIQRLAPRLAEHGHL